MKASQSAKISRRSFRDPTARVASSGSGFAFPSQTTYVAHDDGLDGERVRTAEEQVSAWRERGGLPLPDFAEESKIALDDTVRYPPEGSAAFNGKGALGGVGEDNSRLDR